MSDTGYQRRQPPSPLVFSPDTVLSSPQTHNSNSSRHGSGSNTVSMPFVRRHVTRRLKAAKTECDKELQRVTNNITAFFEERLREGDFEAERDRERGRGRRDSVAADLELSRDAFAYHQSTEYGAVLQADGYSSDGGYEAEVEYGRHSRQRTYNPLDPTPFSQPALIHWASSPGLLAASSGSQASPASLRRHNTAPWDRPLSSSVSSSALASSPASSTILLPETSLARKQGVPSRRLSRTIHIPTHPTRSSRSSRSTSRSRSPLPPLSAHTSFSEFGVSGPSSVNRRSSRILVDDPIDPIMTALYDLIGVATGVTDMSISQLTAQPKVCESLVQRIQNIGKAWDDHPDWHGRNWYVQVLLAVASLSRVVEWWEAEKQFWNFDDNDNEQEEPLTFVTKPADDPILPVSPGRIDIELENFRLDEENKVHFAKPISQLRRSRDGQPKHLSTPTSSRETPEPSQSQATRTSVESARVLATERLKLQAETAHNQNIVMELSLDGDHFIWINHAWRVVVGTDPEMLVGTRISDLLASNDWNVFKEATQRLREDDSHTIEARFRLQVEPTVERDPSSGILFQQMEGKGMLMIDREDSQPSHTMWVVKPLAPARYEHDTPSISLEAGDLAPEPASSIVPNLDERTYNEQVIPFDFTRPIMVNPILCRICECHVPQWYFEKHSETCAETHRLEAEIIECNESIAELRSTIRDLTTALERSSSGAIPEYRGMPIFIPAASPIVASPLQLFRANKMQRFGVKKIQKRLLDQLDDILQVALEVAVPTLKEDEAKEPIERQRLLSPGSERKISQIRNWSKPITEDAALSQLLQDGERIMRQKVDNVVRMQNTIRYSEKIWHEWEEKVGQALTTVSETEDDSDSEEEADERSSTRSEYPFGRDASSSGPTPLASSSPAPTPTPSDARSIPYPSAPIPIHGPRQPLHTRSSTPSSISSPLALAAPIVAPSLDDTPPDMVLDGAPTVLQVKPRKSSQSLLEPKFIVTPPASPLFPPRDGPSLTRESSTTKRGHRRHSTINPVVGAPGPLSPRQPSAGPLTRTTPTSIKDFEIIKPISKGAFGSVFLSKKKVTGDYYAIKVLKKADMIAKNQITNVKAERMILMKQAESPFVAKLFFTFQSRENLYLVMEYLNGGDCAALIKSLGSLPEEWTKNYVAEVVLGLDYLHQRGVVHRDLKPDNLLIDQHGHLKLTDFGLSRIGLLGRQTRESQPGRPLTRYNSRSRPPSIDSAYMPSPLFYSDALSGSSYFNQRTQSRISYSPYQSTDDIESSGSESLSGLHTRRSGKAADSPLQSFATELTTDLRSHSNSGSGGTPPGEQKFVGTPDYLAPETILGLRGDDAAVDWWALGVITYEFLYGIPPFHADTPEKVFENILSGNIEWHEDWISFSEEARDFMNSLMTLDPVERLGSNGAEEVKAHPFFVGINWEKVTMTEAAFIPQVSDPESTDYFDPRGAIPQLFHDDEPVAITGGHSTLDSPISGPPPLPATIAVPSGPKEPLSIPGCDDFGSFSFKNLPVLKQANDDVIRKLKTDQMAPLTQTLTEPVIGLHHRKRSVSTRLKKPPNVVTTADPRNMPTNPPSPATSSSSVASSPSRTSLPAPSLSLPTPISASNHHRKPSEYGAVERFKLNYLDGGDRRSRLRTASVSSAGDGSGSEVGPGSHGSGSQPEYSTPPSSVHSIDLRKGPDPNDRVVTCLLAEDNPITAKIIETLLIRLGCRCIVVADGSEAISVAMGDIKFDCILMDLQMPVLYVIVDGESAARYIKNTNSKNTNTPIIAVSAYSSSDPNDTSNVFAASLSKPLQKTDLLAVMRELGFKTSTVQSRAGATKISASHS